MTPDTRLIPLTQGQSAIVDASMYEELARYKWHACQYRRTFYATCNISSTTIASKHTTRHMHIMIMSLSGTYTPGMEVMHLDGNGLNNTLVNLAMGTHAENAKFHKLQINNTTGYTGVSYHKQGKKYHARISINRKSKSVGLYTTAKEAYVAYYMYNLFLINGQEVPVN